MEYPGTTGEDHVTAEKVDAQSRSEDAQTGRRGAENHLQSVPPISQIFVRRGMSLVESA